MKKQDNSGNLPLHLAARANKNELHICTQLLGEMKEMKLVGNSKSGESQDSLIRTILSTKNHLGKTVV